MHVDDLASACLFLLNLPDEAFDAIRSVAPEQVDQTRAKGVLVSADGDVGEKKQVPHINVGSGKDIRISELAEMIRTAVGYRGAVFWDLSMPDGTPQKLLDISRLAQLGWEPMIKLSEGIKSTYQWYLKQTGMD